MTTRCSVSRLRVSNIYMLYSGLADAIMNPNAALQSVVEDYLEAFQQDPQPSLSDIINCVLRCCGSNDSVDSDRVVDYDGIVDALDDFTEALKEVCHLYSKKELIHIYVVFRTKLQRIPSRQSIQCSRSFASHYRSFSHD